MAKTTFQLICRYDVVGDFTEGPMVFGTVPDEAKIRKIALVLNEMLEANPLRDDAPLQNVVFDYRQIDVAPISGNPADYEATVDKAFEWIAPYQV